MVFPEEEMPPEMVEMGVGSSQPLDQLVEECKGKMLDTLADTPPDVNEPDYKALCAQKDQQLENIGVELHDL